MKRKHLATLVLLSVLVLTIPVIAKADGFFTPFFNAVADVINWWHSR